MATHARDTLAAPIEEALNAWGVWGRRFPSVVSRPALGEVLGAGSANTVFVLDHTPALVLRVRHTADSMSVNTPEQEIAIWEQAAALGMAPSIAWVGQQSGAVITTRLQFNDVDPTVHSELLRRIHESSITASRLSLEQTACRYARQIESKGLGHLALDVNIPAILDDLRLLDNEVPCFCHNDLTPRNVGCSKGNYLAIDWEYAASGSRHFDIAIASQGMHVASRDGFAKITAGVFFDKNSWQAACRVALLMEHLWTLAARSQVEDSFSRTSLGKQWMPHE